MNEQEQNPQEGFDLDSYMDLLRRLQKSKADEERLDKQTPVQQTQQLQ
jgi:hypothetical protein